MTDWDRRIRDHRIWEEMKLLGPLIDQSLAIEGLQFTTRLSIERLRSVLGYVGKRLAAADPLLVSPTTLEALANFMGDVRSQLAAFISNKNDGHVQNANDMADNILPIASQIPGVYSADELGDVIAKTTAYRSLVTDAVQQSKQQLDELRTNSVARADEIGATLNANVASMTSTLQVLQTTLANVTASAEIERQRITAFTTDQQNQFTAAQGSRTTQFAESLRLLTDQVNKLISDYQSQFSAGQDTRSKEHAAAETARQSGFAETIADYNKRLASQDADFAKQRNDIVVQVEAELKRLIAEYEDSASQIVQDVKEKQGHVEKLVGVIGNLGVTSGYLRNANNARYAMWGWQAGTLVALVTLSWLAYRTLGTLEDHAGHFNWGGFAARALLLVSLGVIAAYCGTQGDKQSVDERRSRKLALELEAIGPYLAPLPEDEQNKFRLQIGERSFGRDLDHLDHQHKSPTSVLSLFKSKEGKELLSKVLLELLEKGKDAK